MFFRRKNGKSGQDGHYILKYAEKRAEILPAAREEFCPNPLDKIFWMRYNMGKILYQKR